MVGSWQSRLAVIQPLFCMEIKMSYTPLFANLQPQIPQPAPRPVLSRRALMGCLGAVAAGLAMPPSLRAAGLSDAITVPDAQPAPQMTSGLVDATGDEFNMAAFADAPLLVNFWATWCAPCVAELPSLERSAKALAEDGISVMLVSIDRGGPAKALPFLERLGVDTPHLGFDPKARLSREMGVRGLPTTILLDAGHQASWSFVGPFEWDSPAVLQAVRGILGQDTGSKKGG